MSTNPYAPPSIGAEKADQGDREVRTVIRVFRLLGWFGVVNFAPGAIVLPFVVVYSVLAQEGDLLELSIAWMIAWTSIVISVAFISSASKLSKRRHDAIIGATRLCYMMMIGFPIFTFVGYWCAAKLRRHYAAYCAAAET